ncbi:MAG: PEP-CTERM sorting domain-containing protein [Akkermansiaceae bacterium]
MKTIKTTTTLLTILATASVGHAAIMSYNPTFSGNTEGGPNTSGTTPYDANGSGLSEGLTPGTATYNDTYSFLDSTTGIAFSVDFTFTATGGNLGGGNGIGVADNWIDEGESLTIALSSLVVDTSGYIDGTIGGLTGPVGVGSSAFGIHTFSLTSLSAVDPGFVSDGTTTDSVLASSYVFGSGNSLSNTTGEGTLSFVAGVEGDTRFRLTGWKPYIELDIVAVPEPSSTALLGLGGLALILRRRK